MKKPRTISVRKYRKLQFHQKFLMSLKVDLDQFTLVSLLIHIFIYAVKPVYNDHPWETVAVVDRWSLFKGTFCIKCYKWHLKTGFHCYSRGLRSWKNLKLRAVFRPRIIKTENYEDHLIMKRQSFKNNMLPIRKIS